MDFRHANTNSTHDERQSTLPKEPLNKKSTNTLMEDLTASNRSKAIRKMLFRTKLCSEFQLGSCPYGVNCNFAHSIEELRKPPPYWQEFADTHKEEPREESLILVVGESDETEEPFQWKYSMNYDFTLDEEPEIRGSDAICLLSGSNDGRESQESYKSCLDAVYWKTKLCNKWELSGFCPYGSKCRFAHGAPELRPYLGRPMDKEVIHASVHDAEKKSEMDKEVKDASAHDDKKMSEPAKTLTNVFRPPGTSRKLPNAMQKPGERRVRWKGPDKISKIYGDWIDDL